MKIIKTVEQHLHHDFEDSRRDCIAHESLIQKPERLSQGLKDKTGVIT